MVNSEKIINRNARAMNNEQIELYERIQAFSLDRSDAQLSFSKRLAKDNNWSLTYARQVIEEYKKFAFLAVASGHQVTPSDQVDQTWHLHLTYTRSYWDEFCSQVLQTPLHHEPTRGGQSENQKFDDWYSKTLESYEQFFGQTPPIEIWPTSNDRFGRDLHFVRVNTQLNWVLPKLSIHKGATTSVAIFLTLILSGCYINSPENTINPFAGTLLVIIGVVAVFGIIRFIVEIVNFLKKPSLPRSRGSGDGGSCGTSGCGGWGSGWDWGDFSSHSSGDGSSDGGGGSDGGGCGGGSSDGSGSCGGGGCGGGGCGGGGCGGG